MNDRNHERPLSEWAALTGASLPDSLEDRTDGNAGFETRAEPDAAESFDREFGDGGK
jgi:hypothetical protein